MWKSIVHCTNRAFNGGEAHMPSEMKIDAALADLEAGKFSFRMVEAIENHVEKLESELEVTRSLHASAVREMKLLEYANWRLEREVTSLNAKIQALLTVNRLTEEAYRMMRPIAIEVGKYFSASLKCAATVLQRTKANLQSGEFQVQLVHFSSKFYEALKTIAPTEKIFQVILPYAIKMGEYLRVLEKHAATVLARATAYLSNLNKTSG
jgi:hypothetical protein